MCVMCLLEPGAVAGVVLPALVKVAKVFLILFLLFLQHLQLLTTF